MTKRALITGVTGQDGAYLTEFLLAKGYEVHGVLRRAMWMMLQEREPDDYVVATGETHSVQEFVERAFAELGLDWHHHVEIDRRYLRPAEVDVLQGDAKKARERLGWRPKVDFAGLVKMMVAHDHDLARRERMLKSAGYVDLARGAASSSAT